MCGAYEVTISMHMPMNDAAPRSSMKMTTVSPLMMVVSGVRRPISPHRVTQRRVAAACAGGQSERGAQAERASMSAVFE